MTNRISLETFNRHHACKWGFMQCTRWDLWQRFTI